MTRYAIGIGATIIVTYLLWAFVSANLFWLDGVMSWQRSDRGFLIYWLICCVYLGALLPPLFGFLRRS